MSKIKEFLMSVREMYDANYTPTQIANATGMPVAYIMEIISGFDDEDWDYDDGYEVV